MNHVKSHVGKVVCGEVALVLDKDSLNKQQYEATNGFENYCLTT